MRLCILIFILALVPAQLNAKKVLSDFNFSTGEWTLVGIPVHNYKALPIQRELGTFFIREPQALLNLQKLWDLEVTFDDKCDHHYALKFYKGKELMRTLKLNLYCGYLSLEGLSYVFDPMHFEALRASAKTVDWSRISFADLELLKQAITTLDRKPDIFFYDDVKPYRYTGFFMMGVGNLPWNANLDSLDKALNSKIVAQTGKQDFYLKKYFHLVQGDKLSVRYIVNCEPVFARSLPKEMIYMPWRSHLHNADSVRVVAVGLDRARYLRVMDGRE